jgi:hypothetical protein
MVEMSSLVYALCNIMTSRKSRNYNANRFYAKRSVGKNQRIRIYLKWKRKISSSCEVTKLIKWIIMLNAGWRGLLRFFV